MAKLLGGTIVYGTGTVQTILYVQGTTSSTSTASGALQVVGGAGIGGNLYVGGTIYGTFSGSVTGAATSATNIIGGSAGSIPIQSSPGVTTFINTGSVGNLLQQRVGNTATFVSTSTLQIGYSSNVAGGTAGQLVYQSAPNTTGFVNTGSVGQLLMSSGTSAPLYVNTSSIYVGYAVYANTATNISGGSTGSVVYQSATGTTAMLALSTAGYVLTAGTSGPQWSPVSAIQSNTATNIAGGTAGQILYQTGPGQTSFVSTSTAGYVLTSNGTGSPVYQNTLTLIGTTAAISTNSGALQVAGGVGLGGDLYLGGNFIQVGNTHGTLATTYNLINTTATTVNFAGAGTTVSIGAASGTTTVKNNLTVVGNLTIQGTTTVVDSTVTNIADPIIMLGGGPGDTAPSVDDNKDRGVAFKWFSGGAARTGFFGYQDSTGFFTFISSATITNEVVAAAGGSTKGALDAYLAGGTAQSLVYQSSPNVTAFLAAGTSGYILQTNGTGSAPSWVPATGLTAGSSTTATNIAAGTAGQLHYQTAPGQTSFVGTGTVGQLLMSSGTSAPLYVTTSNIRVGNAANIAAGTAGMIPIQSGLGATAFINTGTVGYLLQMQVGNTATWVSTSGLSAGNSSTATNIAGGTAGQLHYQTAPGQTSFVGTGTVGQLLMSSGTSAPLYVNTASIIVGNAANIAAGTAGMIPIQSGLGATAFINTGTVGYILQMQVGNTATWVSTSSLSAAAAINADNLKTVLTSTNATYYPSFVDSNNAVAGYEAHYTTSSFSINPGTGAVTLTSTVAATSASSGALQVSGGVGIGGALYVTGNISRSTATTTHPLEIIGGLTESTVVGAFRSLTTATTSLISFQNTSQAITTVAGNTGSVLLTAASSQYLSIASNSTLALGAGDFTVEGFYYITQGTLPDACLLDWRNGTNGAGVTQPLLEFQPGGSLGLNWYVNASNRISSGNAAVAFNTWQHFAISRVSGTTSMYIAGTRVGSPYTDGNTYPQGSLFIGHANDGALGRYFPGYISNIRIVVGTGLYSGTTLTVPTTNLTAVTNTKLLLNTINGGSFLADSSGASVAVTNNNGATSSAFAPFVGTATTTYNDIVNIGSSGTSLVLQTNAVTRLAINSNGIVTVSSSTNASSTVTGALIVTGGVGIGGTLYVGSLRADATTSATTFGIFYNPTTKELTTATSGLAAGTATTSSQLQTVGTATNATYFPTFVDSNNSSLIGESIFTTSTFQINPYTGNVGISASPITTATYRLNVANIIQVGGQGGSDVTQIGGGGGTGSFIRGYYGVDGSQAFNITGNGNSYVNASTAGGNLGVGINAPSQKLDVYSNSATVSAAVRSAFAGGSAQILLAGNNTAVGTGEFLISHDGSANAYLYNRSSTPMIFGTANTERIRITANGGISFGATGTAYGTAGQILQSNGDAAPTWVSTGSLTAGIATTSSQLQTVGIATNASYYPSFVDSNNVTAIGELHYTTSTFSINPSTGVVSLTSTAAAASTTTGALRVTGGVGIQGDLYAKDIYTNGVKAIPLNIQEFTASGAQTTFTVTGGYTVGTVQVFANGINLGSGDFTASNGTTVVVGQARNAGDIIRIISGGISSSINNIQSFSIAMSVAMAM